MRSSLGAVVIDKCRPSDAAHSARRRRISSRPRQTDDATGVCFAVRAHVSAAGRAGRVWHRPLCARHSCALGSGPKCLTERLGSPQSSSRRGPWTRTEPPFEVLDQTHRARTGNLVEFPRIESHMETGHQLRTVEASIDLLHQWRGSATVTPQHRSPSAASISIRLVESDLGRRCSSTRPTHTHPPAANVGRLLAQIDLRSPLGRTHGPRRKVRRGAASRFVASVAQSRRVTTWADLASSVPRPSVGHRWGLRTGRSWH
jgi:hypothetical protein